MKDSTISVMTRSAKELSAVSSFDATSIFVVIALVLFVGILIAIIYKVVINQIKFLSRRLDDILSLLKASLNSFQKMCSERHALTNQNFDESSKYVNSSLENLFNTFVEIMGEGFVCSTPIALSLFNSIMSLHCINKASKLYDRIKIGNSTASQMITLLSHDFRIITEEEKELLDKIRYTNAHRLGDELEDILKKENWDSFTNNKITYLVNLFIGRNPSWTDVREETIALFMDLITPMKDNIRKKGGM